MSDAPVLYLDADDEITSAAARIRETEADRLALVIPYGSRLATSRINFRLLAREASERGKVLEIVAADPSARALAMTAGLTVHASVAAFEQPATVVPVPPPDEAPTSVILVPRAGGERVPVVGRARPPVRPRVAIAFALGLVVLLAVGGFLAVTLLPSASIDLSPWSASIGPLTATVVADPTVVAVDPASLTVPAQQITLDVAVSQTFQATGKLVTEAKAQGSVTFENCDTGGAVTIPVGSRVATSGGVAFLTGAKVTIKRAMVFPFACRTGSVSVEAVLAGTDGNVAAGQINRIPPGYDAIVLRVTNTNPTTGGVHDETPKITQADVDGALATLAAALPAQMDQQLAGGVAVPSGVTLYPETKRLGTTTPTLDPRSLVGKEQAGFDLGLSAKGTVLGVDPSPIRALAENQLAPRVQAGWALDPASVRVDIGVPVVVGTTVQFPVTLAANQVRTVDRASLLAEIRGLDLPAARARLDALGNADVRLWPDWVTTIPTNADRVTLTIHDPTPMPTPSP